MRKIGFKNVFHFVVEYSVGKQSPCMLSFVYTSYDRAGVRTVFNFGNRALLFSY